MRSSQMTRNLDPAGTDANAPALRSSSRKSPHLARHTASHTVGSPGRSTHQRVPRSMELITNSAKRRCARYDQSEDALAPQAKRAQRAAARDPGCGPLKHVDALSRERPAIGRRHFASQPRSRAAAARAPAPPPLRKRPRRFATTTPPPRRRCQTFRRGRAADRSPQCAGRTSAHGHCESSALDRREPPRRRCPTRRRIDDQHRAMLATETSQRPAPR